MSPGLLEGPEKHSGGKIMSTGIRSIRVRTRRIDERALLPEEAVVTRGFAGLTFNDYPEPARSYTIAFWRLAPIWEQMGLHTPLLLYVQGELAGIMNSIWSSRVGIVPVQRVSQDQLEIPAERVRFLTGESIATISVSTHEILLEPPPWCR
jgi:hypothetical protein